MNIEDVQEEQSKEADGQENDQKEGEDDSEEEDESHEDSEESEDPDSHSDLESNIESEEENETPKKEQRQTPGGKLPKDDQKAQKAVAAELPYVFAGKQFFLFSGWDSIPRLVGFLFCFSK